MKAQGVCSFLIYTLPNVAHIEVHANGEKIAKSTIMIENGHDTMTVESFTGEINCNAYEGESCIRSNSDGFYEGGHLTLCIIHSIAYSNLNRRTIRMNCKHPRLAYFMYKIYYSTLTEKNTTAAQNTVSTSHPDYLRELFLWSRSKDFTKDYSLFCNFFKRYPTMPLDDDFCTRPDMDLTYEMLSTNYTSNMVRRMAQEWVENQNNVFNNSSNGPGKAFLFQYCTSCARLQPEYRAY